MVKPGYKETEVGLIPEDWSIIDFRKCFTILPNNTYSRAEMNENGTIMNIHYGDILVQYGSILDCNSDNIPYLTDACTIINKSAYLSDGDVVLADTAEDETVGKAAEIYNIQDRKIVSGLHTIPCRPNFRFAQRWLGYYINSALFHNQLLPFITGTKVSAIAKNAIGNIKILCPSIQEQQKIAEALSDMDELIASLEKLIAKKKAVKQGAMQELLTGKKRLPGFSGEWHQYRYKDICQFINGRAYSQQELLKEGKYKVLRLGNLFTNEHWYYTDLELDEKLYCNKGDLIYAWSASFGPRIWLGDKVVYHYHIWKVHCLESVNKIFLYHYFMYDTKAMEQELQGGTMFHLTKDTMENRYCRIPGLNEQQAIATILSDMDAEIEALEQKLAKCRQTKQGMMQQLLTGKIRLV